MLLYYGKIMPMCFGLRKHLVNETPGWNGTSMVCVEWLHRSHVYGLPCVSHLWMATQEQRDLICLVLRNFQCSHMAYGFCLDQLSCKNSARWTEGGSDDRMERIHGGLRY